MFSMDTLSLRTSTTSCKAHRGFTLVEILVVVAILALLSAVGLPAFQNTIDRYRVSVVVDDLSMAITLARAEAIKRSGNVRLERLTGTGCPTLTSTTVWSCGWQVYWDANNNNAFNSGTDELIREFRITNGVTVNAAAGLGAGLTANRWGQLNGANAAGFNVVPPSGVSSTLTTAVCLSSGGRIRKLQNTADCP
jgi:type IV fimbrial biogenesis protein FimT